MRLVTLAMTLALAFGGSAGAQTSSDDSVHVGVFMYRPDGSVMASAFDTLPSSNAMVYSGGSSCRVGAGRREPPQGAVDAWRFSGKVLSVSADVATVQLDWQRVLEHGARSQSESSVQLTLRAGEWVTLDRVAGPFPFGCGASAVAFEARYGSRPMEIVVRPDNGAEFSAGRTATERVQAYRVSLWFIGHRPGEPDQVIAHPVLVTTREASFAFPPVMSGGAGGNMRVLVTGSLEIRNGANGAELVFNAQRRASPLGIGGLRDRPADIHGTSTLTMPLPGPEEVLSFEMPPIRLPGGAELPDRFSVRVQIRPR